MNIQYEHHHPLDIRTDSDGVLMIPHWDGYLRVGPWPTLEASQGLQRELAIVLCGRPPIGAKAWLETIPHWALRGIVTHWTWKDNLLELLRVLAAGDEEAAESVFEHADLYALALDAAWSRGFELSALAPFKLRDLARFLGLYHYECFTLIERKHPMLGAAEFVNVLRVASIQTLLKLHELPCVCESVTQFLRSGLIGESDLEVSLLALIQNEPEAFGLIDAIVQQNLANQVFDWPYRGVRTVSDLEAILCDLPSGSVDSGFDLPPPLAGADWN